jgi:hypothetical protein
MAFVVYGSLQPNPGSIAHSKATADGLPPRVQDQSGSLDRNRSLDYVSGGFSAVGREQRIVAREPGGDDAGPVFSAEAEVVLGIVAAGDDIVTGSEHELVRAPVAADQLVVAVHACELVVAVAAAGEPGIACCRLQVVTAPVAAIEIDRRIASCRRCRQVVGAITATPGSDGDGIVEDIEPIDAPACTVDLDKLCLVAACLEIHDVFAAGPVAVVGAGKNIDPTNPGRICREVGCAVNRPVNAVAFEVDVDRFPGSRAASNLEDDGGRQQSASFQRLDNSRTH